MRYCNYIDVQDITGTTLDYDTINRLIDKADDRIARVLQREKLGYDFETVAPRDIRNASMYLTASIIKQREISSGTTPDSLSIMGISIKNDNRKDMKNFEEIGLGFLNDYIRRKKNVNTSFAIVSEYGERKGEYDAMDRWREIED